MTTALDHPSDHATAAAAAAARADVHGMLGRVLPAFTAQALVSGEYGKEYVALDEGFGQDRWRVYLHWPAASLLTSPRELTAFAARLEEFFLLKTLLIGVAGDTHSLLHSLRGNGRHVGHLPYPIIDDRTATWAQALGLSQPGSSTLRPATIIVAPDNRIRLIRHHDRSHCRSVDAVLGELAALQDRHPTLARAAAEEPAAAWAAA